MAHEPFFDVDASVANQNGNLRRVGNRPPLEKQLWITT